MPVLSGSFETGWEGWAPLFTEGAYRGNFGQSRTGSWYVYNNYSPGIVYKCPPEMSNSKIQASVWVRCNDVYTTSSQLVIFANTVDNLDNPQEIAYGTGVTLQPDSPYQLTSVDTSTVDTNYPFMWIVLFLEGVIDLVDDWSISYEPNTSTFCKDNNIWKPANKYVKHNGVWKPSAPTRVRHAGVWKDV